MFGLLPHKIVSAFWWIFPSSFSQTRLWAWIWSWLWFVGSRIVLGGAVFFLLLTVVFKFANPPFSIEMLREQFYGRPVTHRWIDFEKISPHLKRAVILAEDGQFCYHYGIDWRQMKHAWEEAMGGKEKPRGASTITMQLIKNLYLWPERSYVRKALEIPLAMMVDLIWSKQRQLELYLNIVEWGPGIYGVQAASLYHFKTLPERLSARQAALLAGVLPNPIQRNAGKPGPYTRRIALIIQKRMKTGHPWVNCIMN